MSWRSLNPDGVPGWGEPADNNPKRTTDNALGPCDKQERKPTGKRCGAKETPAEIGNHTRHQVTEEGTVTEETYVES